MFTKLILFGAFSVVAVITSVVVIGLYWWDKRAAKKSVTRVSERTLHMWSLAGGWPGALYASERFRHKTQKRSFRLRLWASVVGNLLIWLMIVYLFG